nr:MAG TPA: hypothetical protein [Caudoviricetes sp.]
MSFSCFCVIIQSINQRLITKCIVHKLSTKVNKLCTLFTKLHTNGVE